MRNLGFKVFITLAALAFARIGAASVLINQRQAWQREFNYTPTRGEVLLWGSEFELKLNSLLQDDVINIRAAVEKDSAACRYALGSLRYSDPRARMKVEEVDGLDAKSIASGSGWLGIQRPADPKMRLFADIEVPPGTMVKVVVGERTMIRGKITKGACLANGTVWPPYKSRRHVVVHAMLRQTFNSPDDAGPFVNLEGLSISRGERKLDLPMVSFRGRSEGEWVAIELHIGKDGKVVEANPLIGSPELIDETLRLISDWQFEAPALGKGWKVIRTVAVFALNGGSLRLSSPTEK